MTENTKKNKDMTSKMEMLVKVSAATALIALSGWLFMATMAESVHPWNQRTQWEKYQEKDTQNWKQQQYVGAILSAPGIKSRMNRYAVLCIQQEANTLRFQTDMDPIEENGILDMRTLKELMHMPVESLENILQKPELSYSNGYDFQKKLWNERKKSLQKVRE